MKQVMTGMWTWSWSCETATPPTSGEVPQEVVKEWCLDAIQLLTFKHWSSLNRNRCFEEFSWDRIAWQTECIYYE
jgi:hypothetical protein